MSPRTSTSPSSASEISTPGAGGPTVPSLIRSGGLTQPAPHVSDIPHSSASGMPIAWKNSSTSSGVGAAPTLTARTSSKPSILRRPAKICSSAAATSAASSAGTCSPRCSRRTFSTAAASARSVRCALLLGLAGDHRLQARLELLPDAWHGEEPLGAHVGQVGEHLARVGAAGDLHAVHDRHVVVGVALGDVRGGQPRDHARAPAGTAPAARCRRRCASDCGARAARPSAGPSCRRCRSA